MPSVLLKENVIYEENEKKLFHGSNDINCLLAAIEWNDISFDFFSVNKQACNALLYLVRVLDFNVVSNATINTCYIEIAKLCRRTWVN